MVEEYIDLHGQELGVIILNGEEGEILLLVKILK